MKNKRVLVDYKRLLEEFDSSGNDLVGYQGFCLVKDNLIRKIYFEPKTIKYDLSKYKSSKISFPLGYLYDVKNLNSEKVIGEIMEYFPKKSITWSLTSDIEIDELIRQYYEMIMEITKYYEINMSDICTPNILYNQENGFSIIDTTSWIIDEKRDNTRLNKIRFGRGISKVLLDDILEITPLDMTGLKLYQNLKKYGQCGYELYKILFLSIMEDEYHVIEMLELYCELFKNGQFGPIKTVGDIEKYTKMLKKG